MIEVRVNGEIQKVAEKTSIQDLLAALGVDPQRVAVEYNWNILGKEEYKTCRLQQGDQIEIVHFVGGGCGRYVED
jgi:thiamine biosynthesis protein ThiS